MPYKDYYNPKNVAYRKAYYERNKERLKENYRRNSKKWRDNNREFCAELHKEYYMDNRDEVLKRQKESYQRHKQKRHETTKKKIADLTDGYMKNYLIKLGYTRKDIRTYPDLIETHRILIKTKRLWRSKTSNN